jgi:FHA domain/von Willebrand factor type A domain
MRNLIVVITILILAIPLFGESTQSIAILLDVSKSVPPDQFLKAKQVIQTLTSQTPPTDKVSIYAFGNSLRRVDPADLDSLRADESYTELFDAAYDVAQDLEKTEGDHKAILIVSDGKDTKSATILEDTVAYTNSRGIAIYSLGVGQVQQKSFERIAKLTGGKYFQLDDPGFPDEFRMLVSQQPATIQRVQASPVPEPIKQSPAQQSVAKPLSQSPREETPVAQKQQGFSDMWMIGLLGILLLLSLGAFFLVRAFSRRKRVCPTCGRPMKSSQIECPYCTGTVDERIFGDGTQELPLLSGSMQGGGLAAELLQKKPEFDVSLTKTFVLTETPVLVVRKGKNIGQTFSLNRFYPVSVGRSRVNEIRLDDAAVSGQHCRIIPENGKHVLCDLSSTNGTFLNDKKVTKEVLKEGDILRIGETQFLYRLEQHGS